MCKVQYKEDTTIRTVAPLRLSAQLKQFYFRLYKENTGSRTRVTWVNFWSFTSPSEIRAIQLYLPGSITQKNCSTYGYTLSRLVFFQHRRTHSLTHCQHAALVTELPGGTSSCRDGKKHDEVKMQPSRSFIASFYGLTAAGDQTDRLRRAWCQKRSDILWDFNHIKGCFHLINMQ